MAFKMQGFSAFTQKTKGDALTVGVGGEHTTYETTYYNKDGKKVTGITEEDTGKIKKEGDIEKNRIRRYVMHNDGRKLYIDK